LTRSLVSSTAIHLTPPIPRLSSNLYRRYLLGEVVDRRLAYRLQTHAKNLGYGYMDLRPLNPPVSIIAYKLPPLQAFTVVLSKATLSRLSFPVEYPMVIKASRILDHTPITLRFLNLF
jgi:hypothetical protein